jgi:hypothetical protein
MICILLSAWKGGNRRMISQILMRGLVIESVMLKVIYRLLFNLILFGLIILLFSREEEDIKRLWVIHYHRPILELPGVEVSAIVT